jgi:hypothetical protein
MATDVFDNAPIPGCFRCHICNCNLPLLGTEIVPLGASLRAEIERLTVERDEWASKWHKVRAELAELKYPGMKGIIRTRSESSDYWRSPAADSWTCIHGRICGGSGFMKDAALELEHLRDLLHRSWFKGAHMEPGLQDEVLAYFGHSAEAKDG